MSLTVLQPTCSEAVMTWQYPGEQETPQGDWIVLVELTNWTLGGQTYMFVVSPHPVWQPLPPALLYENHRYTVHLKLHAPLQGLADTVGYSLRWHVHTEFVKDAWPTGDDQELADKVANMVLGKFNVLNKDADTKGHRVIAGVVMTTDSDLDTAKVITVTTGTKCINGGYINRHGEMVNDCHAEILARRCLRSYFYSQLDCLLDSPSDCIFEIVKGKNQRCKLKNGIQFHLYISTPPCGSARVDTLPGARNSSPNLVALNRDQGHLRTKVEASEGTVPVRGARKDQTMDGILGTEQLLTMSCSDKISKWNVLGVQGALLSHLLEPIYLSSITIGQSTSNQYQKPRLSWALHERVSVPPSTPTSNFRHHKPLILTTSHTVARQPGGKPADRSLLWVVHRDSSEIENRTGLTQAGNTSFICKAEMMKNFLHIIDRMGNNMRHGNYGEIKKSATGYQSAKQSLYSAFEEANLGFWVGKPVEVDMFTVRV